MFAGLIDAAQLAADHTSEQLVVALLLSRSDPGMLRAIAMMMRKEYQRSAEILEELAHQIEGWS